VKKLLLKLLEIASRIFIQDYKICGNTTGTKIGMAQYKIAGQFKMTDIVNF
jgi:hypothetical protein